MLILYPATLLNLPIPVAFVWRLQGFLYIVCHLHEVVPLSFPFQYLLFLFLKKKKVEYSCFTILCYFLLYSKVNQLYIQPLFFVFPSHLHHQRAVSRVPCGIQQVLISYLSYTQQYVYVNPNFPIHPASSSLFHLVSICLFSMSVPLFLLCKQVHHYHISRFPIYIYIYIRNLEKYKKYKKIQKNLFLYLTPPQFHFFALSLKKFYIYIYMLICDICFTLSDLLHSI